MTGMRHRLAHLVSRGGGLAARGAAHDTRYDRRAALVAVLAMLGACHADGGAPRGVAEQFLDQHYVRIDLEAAKPFCTGLALQKLRDEQKLTQGQAIDESTRQPTVHYRLLETKNDAEHPSFIFQGTIDVDDAGQFTRKWLVTMRRDGDAWKVSNFEEFD
jgi:hypothetical protein